MIIDNRVIGAGSPPWICAEISANHNGSLSRAMGIIGAAKKAGASAVKTQLYDPVRLAEARGGTAKIMESGPWDGRTLLDLYTEAHTPREWFPELFAFAKDIGITLFSSVFDIESVDYLEDLGAPAHKIASFELTNLPLIRRVAQTRKPIILSTGMASWSDVQTAVNQVRSVDFALLHCVSAYPCPVGSANLKRIDHLRGWGNTKYEIGFSDHTHGNTAAICAVALGASILEKHLTISRQDTGPDALFSAEPHEFADYVRATHDAWLAVHGTPSEDVEAPYRNLRSKG